MQRIKRREQEAEEARLVEQSETQDMQRIESNQFGAKKRPKKSGSVKNCSENDKD